MMNELEVLEAAREYISDERRWTSGLWRWNPEFISVCALGAVAVARGTTIGARPTMISAMDLYDLLENDPAVVALARVAREVHHRDDPSWGSCRCVFDVNDGCGWEATLRLFDRAIDVERARAQEFEGSDDRELVLA